MAEKKWYDVVLEYLNNPATYTVVMGILTAFGVKIPSKLQQAIAGVGVAMAQLGLAIEALVYVMKEENDKKSKEV